MTKKLEELLLEGIQAVSQVAPNMYLSANYPHLVDVMRFIEATPGAANAARRVRTVLGTSNWPLDAQLVESLLQTIGEVQFWMLAEKCGVSLEHIRETTTNTADLRMVGATANLPHFEVKTLSVSGGGRLNLAAMAEDSFNAQLELQAAVSRGKRVATAVHCIAPHGEVERGKEFTKMCTNLIDKAVGNIKSGQYAAAPTFMVLNLMLIGSYYTGNTELRPVAFGYPYSWSVRTGVLWTTAFGTMGQLVHGLPDFEGRPAIEGCLGRQGVLANPHFKEIAGLLLVVHSLGEKPVIYGLMREEDMRRFEEANEPLLAAFNRLVGDNWNDNFDSNGWCLNKH